MGPEAKAFVGRAETLLWFLFLFGQVGLWLALQPPAWRAFKAVETCGRRCATAFGLVAIGVCTALVVYLGFTVQPDYPLPGHGWKLAIVTGLGLVAIAPGALCLALASGDTQRDSKCLLANCRQRRSREGCSPTLGHIVLA
jgi:hypothetical protein